jgi:hypothetical protein
MVKYLLIKLFKIIHKYVIVFNSILDDNNLLFIEKP